MNFIKINGTIYPATVIGRSEDREWDNRASKAITLDMSYEAALDTFVNGSIWSIIHRNEVAIFDDSGEMTGTEVREDEVDCSEFNISGDITDHRDGRITVKMGKLTALEEAYKTMFGGI